MKNNINIIFLKDHLIKSIVLFSLIFLSMGFLNKPDIDKKFTDVTMKVEQESNAITISVKTSKDNKVQFYMFTVEGNLIKELTISGSKKISILSLEKGIYLYEFFNNDERLKSGKIELK